MNRNHRSPVTAGRWIVMLLAGVLATAAFAGGPIYTFDYANRVPYAWKPSSWANGQVPVLTDLGPLGFLSNQRANEMVAFATNQWSSVPTSSFRNTVVGDFSLLGLGDVDYTNVTSIINAWNGGGIFIIYDADGSIMSNYFGVGATSVLGMTNIDFVAPDGPEIYEAWMVLSGPGIRNDDTSGVGFQGVVTHEMGHALNLAHSQANGAVQHATVLDYPQPDGCPAPWTGGPDVTQIETMYPLATPEPGQSGEYMATVDRIDDMAALSDLYPAEGYPGTQGTIRGVVRDAAGNPVTGINVIARNSTDPFNDFSSYITGQVSKGYEGPDGSFVLNGLTPGARYVLYVDNLESGGFSVPRSLVLPGPEEYYNGADEGADAALDSRCAWTTLAVAPNSPITADITFGKYDGAPTFMTAPSTGVPTDITPDGSIVVGEFGGYAPVFRWDLNTGAFDNIGGAAWGQPSISDDGTRIAADYLADDGIYHPAIYENGVWTPLPPTPGAVGCTDGHGTAYGSAYDISGDGRTVVGLSYGTLGCNTATIRGFKWTATGGSVQLPKVNSLSTAGRANAVNYDGSVIVGWDDASTGFRRGEVWKNGVASLILYRANWVGEAIEVSRNGTWVLGASSFYTTGQAYRYNTATKVTELLGNFGTNDGAVANSFDDANVVISGYSSDNYQGLVTPAIWTAHLHWSNFNNFLWAQGVNTSGIAIGSVTSMSADGRVMDGLVNSRYGYVPFVVKTPTSVVCHVPAADPTHPVTQVVSFPQGMDSAIQAGDTLGPCACSAATPTGIPTLAVGTAAPGSAHLNWTSVIGATGYDIARGDLAALSAFAGDFGAATTDCLESALRANSYDDAAGPKEGNGFWYLVRAMSCGGRGTYDSGAPSQVGSRDAGIATSTAPCP